MAYGYLKINVASVDNRRASIFFKYNEQAVSILKSAVPYPKRFFCREDRTWSVDIRSIPALIKSFEAGGVDGTRFECSALIDAYLKYCERNGAVATYQPDLFRNTNTASKSISGSILPPDYPQAGETGIQDAQELIYPEGSSFSPYKHQIIGAQILLREHKYILADTMGLGKTFTAIMAAHTAGGRKLVVAPASLKLNWRNEILKFGIEESAVGIISSATAAKDIGTSAEWVITNYECLGSIRKHTDLVSWASGFTTVIFDEAHYCKSVNSNGAPGSLRGKYSLKISETVPNVYLLTGTPITNKTKDLFILLKMIGSPLGENWYGFADRYCGPEMTDYGWQYNGSENQQELNRRLSACMLRRRTEEVLDMPEKRRSYIPVAANMKDYIAALKDYLCQDEDGDERGSALACLAKMKMAAAAAKVDKTCSIISDILENGKSVVVYSCYLDVVGRICGKFAETCVKITGSVSAEERQQAVEDFQSGRKKVIVCTISAGGVGLTLTRSDIVVFNDFDYTAANMRQAEDRIWRIGQRNTCSIYYIYADGCGMDEKLRFMLDKKLSNMGMIIDGRKESLVTEKDSGSQLALLRNLMEMKKDAEKRRKNRMEPAV